MSLHRIQLRRREPNRIRVDSLCSLFQSDRERHGLVVDVSENGLRIQRTLGGPRERSVQLEFEIPDVDEIIWARGEICFDQVWNLSPRLHGLSGLVRTSGVRLVMAAERHKKLLRDFVAYRRDVVTSAGLPGL
jgi:hypothetical protein